MKIFVLALSLLSFFGCGEDKISKAELEGLKALPSDKYYSQLDSKQKDFAKKIMVRALEKAANDDLATVHCESAPAKNCLETAKEKLANFKKMLKNDAQFEVAFQEYLPAYVVASAIHTEKLVARKMALKNNQKVLDPEIITKDIIDFFGFGDEGAESWGESDKQLLELMFS